MGDSSAAVAVAVVAAATAAVAVVAAAATVAATPLPQVLPLPTFRKLRARVLGIRADTEVLQDIIAMATPNHARVSRTVSPKLSREISPTSGRKRCRKLGARPRRAGGVSEHYNTLTSHRSPSSVADAIEHIAERIMVKAAEQATRVVDREANRTRK